MICPFALSGCCQVALLKKSTSLVFLLADWLCEIKKRVKGCEELNVIIIVMGNETSYN